MATPMRASRPDGAWEKTPNGRFWRGNSLASALGTHDFFIIVLFPW